MPVPSNIYSFIYMYTFSYRKSNLDSDGREY